MAEVLCRFSSYYDGRKTCLCIFCIVFRIVVLCCSEEIPDTCSKMRVACCDSYYDERREQEGEEIVFRFRTCTQSHVYFRITISWSSLLFNLLLLLLQVLLSWSTSGYRAR